jgi:GTP-binding protein
VTFLDELRISVKAGDGGDGSASFRREKYVPKGGPDGGDGGAGGDIVIRAERKILSLESLGSKRIFRAEDGRPGTGNKCHGRDGRDLVLRVPAGTLVKDAERGHVLKDLDADGASVIVANGGKGGRGNPHFASAENRTPRRAEHGKPGESRTLVLELKLIADVGLLGYPNAGKSTLLGALSSAAPRVGSYPFTTLTPNLGILEVDWEPYVIADVPGIIEGAHQGKGLGHRFLRHVERTRVVLHLIDAASDVDPAEAYRAIRAEIAAYGSELASKPEIVVLTKMDLVEDRDRVAAIARNLVPGGAAPHLVSAHTGEGLEDLVRALVAAVRGARPA